MPCPGSCCNIAISFLDVFAYLLYIYLQLSQQSFHFLPIYLHYIKLRQTKSKNS